MAIKGFFKNKKDLHRKKNGRGKEVWKVEIRRAEQKLKAKCLQWAPEEQSEKPWAEKPLRLFCWLLVILTTSSNWSAAKFSH